MYKLQRIAFAINNKTLLYLQYKKCKTLHHGLVLFCSSSSFNCLLNTFVIINYLFLVVYTCITIQHYTEDWVIAFSCYNYFTDRWTKNKNCSTHNSIWYFSYFNVLNQVDVPKYGKPYMTHPVWLLLIDSE